MWPFSKKKPEPEPEANHEITVSLHFEELSTGDEYFVLFPYNKKFNVDFSEELNGMVLTFIDINVFYEPVKEDVYFKLIKMIKEETQQE